jgi:phage protein D
MAQPWSRSVFRLIVGGADISARVAPVLISLQCVDKAGATSDTARFTLDDTGGRIIMPDKGEPVSIYLGNTAQGIVQRFGGFVDTVRSQGDRGGGRRLEVNAKGMDTTSGAKEPRRKHKDDATLKDAAGDFARAAGLDGVSVHADLASLRRPYWAMDGESFIAWGRRVAAETGATFKIVGRKALFVPRSAGLSASGKALATVYATVGDNLISWDLAPFRGRPEFETVRGRWYDVAAARYRSTDVQIEGGGGGRRDALKRSGADEDEAKGGATGEAKDAARDKGGGRVDIVGTPTAIAEAPCIVGGTRPGTDGGYTIETVTDNLERGRGWICSLDLVKPGEKTGKDTRK